MASIIDGVTYKGYWKLTPDDTKLNEYKVVPKESIYYCTINLHIVFTSDPNGAHAIIHTDANTMDHLGNKLNTPAKVAEYLSIWR